MRKRRLMEHFVIVGAGQAGASLIAKLRSAGFAGKITLIGTEAVPPYQRPPLSKAYLLGEMAEDRLYLRPGSWYADEDITLRLSTTVSAIDPDAKTVTLSDGERIAFDKLALTTGATPRKLPAAIGGDLQNVFTVRDLADADAMAPFFAAGKRALVIGGGYIGLEAAAVAAKRGVDVTLIEMADRILQRVAAPQTSDFFRKLHEDHGVRILEDTGLARLLGEDQLTGAELSDGTKIALDFAIVGIGIAPNIALAEAAGLKIDGGIVTDDHCRTSHPDIFAAGDCATSTVRGTRLRVESVGNAIDMAENAALNMLGQDVTYEPKPWFWSDQYDCKLQIAGLNLGWTDVHVRDRGDGAVSHWYYAGDQLIAVDAMNDPRAYMVGKRLIEAGKSPAPEDVTGLDDLKPLLRA